MDKSIPGAMTRPEAPAPSRKVSRPHQRDPSRHPLCREKTAGAVGQITGSESRHPVPLEGRIAIVTNVGAGCDGRGWRALTRCANADGESVWS
jgi:hypothetical protein